tara:strand:- start:292 stop:651 length:360 start_codon:yes stop_codon:yes gene_type:complete
MHSFLTFNMIMACVLFAFGQMFGWFHLNSQFVWEWWKDKPFSALIVFSLPAGLCFWLGMKLAYAEMSEVWGPRFLIFGFSYVTFPLLTWYFLNESMFTPKTIACVVLSFVIIGIQIFWR